ncbi:taste receptor type 2 member 1 [Elephas maximus indicus]|uniref:taste receptor type 2 member 1 n=1 Tax=Elephas maximus indicus TaxID=99487 RepID=UPI00211648F3|nr:taste receptor type 2 member 1 [Elephas maximus indicus]
MLYSHLIHLLFSVIQLLSGILANCIILVGSSRDLIRRRTWTSLDALLSCLGISRICMQLTFFYLTLVFLSLIEGPVLSEAFSVSVFINESGLWFATWLGVFYCAKIANISHPLFFWLKMKISKLVPWLIPASLLYAAIISVFHSKYTQPILKKIWLQHFSKNATAHSKEDSAFLYSVFAIELFLPLLIFLASVLLLVFSLVKHTRQMRRTVVGTRDLCRSSHLSPMLSILSFLVLYLSHYVAGILIIFSIVQAEGVFFLFCVFVAGTYPSAHSIILILGNHKLKQSTKMFLLHSRCCL